MATFRAIASFCGSLMKLLDESYPKKLRTEADAKFFAVSAADLDGPDKPEGTRVTLFLYRVKLNETLRNAPTPVRVPQVRGVAVDLHFLITIWAENPLAEHLLTGWVISELLRRPVLDLSILSSDGGWETGETVQVFSEDLSTEELMRIWDALRNPYRPSLPFVARGVRIDDVVDAGAPVVAIRLRFSEKTR